MSETVKIENCHLHSSSTSYLLQHFRTIRRKFFHHFQNIHICSFIGQWFKTWHKDQHKLHINDCFTIVNWDFFVFKGSFFFQFILHNSLIRALALPLWLHLHKCKIEFKSCLSMKMEIQEEYRNMHPKNLLWRGRIVSPPSN